MNGKRRDWKPGSWPSSNPCPRASIPLRSWYQLHLQAVQELALQAGKTPMIPSTQLQHDAEILNNAFPDFRTMHVEDAEGRAIAFHPPLNEKGERTLGLDFSTRPWFQEIKAKQRPLVSEVFTGQMAVFSPIVNLSVPFFKGTHWLGCATGTLDLNRMQDMLRAYRPERAVSLTLTDRQDRIIASTDQERPPLQVWNRRKSGVSQPLHPPMYLWRPDDSEAPSMSRWKQSFYVQEISLDPDLPWKLTAESPVAPLQALLYILYVKNLAIMAGLTALALLLSQMFSGSLTRPLARLAQVTAHLPEKLLEARNIDWPASSTLEVDLLIRNFKAMATALDVNFQRLQVQSDELRQANLGLGQEVRDRQQAQEALHETAQRLNLALTAGRLGIWEWEIKNDVLIWNDRMYELYGVPGHSSPIGFERWEKSIHPDDRINTLNALQLAIAGAKDYDIQFRIVHPDNVVKHIKANGLVIRDADGRATRMIGLNQDITEHMETEEQLRQVQKMEAIGTLAGGIAHDFNNILAAILGYAELANLDIDEGSQAKYNLRQSLKATHRAKDLVQQILSFSHRGKQERKPLDIRPIMEEGLKFLRSSLPTTIEIRREMEEDLGTIEADPTQVHQILMNLCTNAAHAMDERGGMLLVSLGKVTVDRATSAAAPGIEPGSYLRLRVSDTGHGMPPEMMKRIFEPYFTTKEVGKGTGLGLAVVHGIVKSYGGGITVSSEPGKGSTFDVYLPRIEGSSNLLTPDRPEPLPLGRRERVLYVDDEKAIVEIGRNILEHLGYEVAGETSSVEALELFREQPDRFDLVITDMTMPNMTGDKLAQEILRIRPGMPIILCTGFSEHITEERARAMGIKEYVLKPLAIRDLAVAIRKALEKQSEADPEIRSLSSKNL